MDKATVVAFSLSIEVEVIRSSIIPGCVVVRFADREFHVSSWMIEGNKEGYK